MAEYMYSEVQYVGVGDTVKLEKKIQPTSKEEAVWIKPTGMMPPEYHGHYECSSCGFFAMKDWRRNRLVLTEYCPGCGKHMKNGDRNG